MGDGFVGRVGRALRLDTTLYREVAAPGASTEQAALTVVLAAVGLGFAQTGTDIFNWLNFGQPGLTTIQANAWILAHFQNAAVVVRTLAIVAAWPVWAVGLWLVARGINVRGNRPPGLWQIARAIGFALTPGAFGAFLLVPVTVTTAFVFPGIPSEPNDLRDPMALPWLGLLQDVGWSLLLIWVFWGTLLAVRETLGLTSGQALGALVTVATGHGLLVILVLTIASVIAAAIGVIPDAFEPVTTIAPYTDLSERIAAEVPAWTIFGFDIYFGRFISDALVSPLSSLLAIVR